MESPPPTSQKPVLVGNLPDGLPIVFFPPGSGDDGYLDATRPLRRIDFDERDGLILTGPIAGTTSELDVSRASRNDWYYVEYDAS